MERIGVISNQFYGLRLQANPNKISDLQSKDKKSMRRQTVLLALVAMMSAVSLPAQTVYKTVGPDGKIVYSDKPPVLADTPASVVDRRTGKADVPAPVSPSGSANSPSGPATSAQGAKPGAAANAEKSRAVDPELEAAVIGVLGLEDLVQQSTDLCVQTLPTSLRKYGGVATDWKTRNATFVTLQRRLLTEAFSPDVGQRIVAAVKAKNERALAPVRNAPVASAIKWCDQSTGAIQNGSMDISGKPKLSAPLMNYRVKPG